MDSKGTFMKAALVTGGAIRVGKGIALALAKQGYDIALHYHSSVHAARETQQQIQQIGVQCTLFQTDLSNPEQLETLIPTVVQHFPHLNVLINSASTYQQATIQETTLDIFNEQWATNLRAPFFLIQQFAQHCKQGNIINIIDNKIGFNQFQYAAYLLAKKALAELTKMAAMEFAPNIRINGIAPGIILPPPSRTEDYNNWRKQGIPLQRFAEITEITQAISSLIENNYITGHVLVVDGGELLTNTGRNTLNFN
jgi:NAD(P)-dependent dehydrogenase (short-subunit alcohol dehydrogenase family)